jgi:hypothetical protein
MQHLLLALSILLLIVIAGNKNRNDEGSKRAVVIEVEKPKEKKIATVPDNWFSISSRFEMIVN